MHTLQKRLLQLAKQEDIAALGYRRLGEKIGVDHPQQVKWHLQKLIKDGQLVRTATGTLRAASQAVGAGLVSLPVLGRANCGEALVINEDSELEPLTISKTLLPRKPLSTLFAVEAVGDSMNQAAIAGEPIENGDYVVVDSSVEVPSSGDYVVSSIDGAANIKRFKRDEDNRLIALLSESTKPRPPIVVAPEDLASLRIHGVVRRVIKTGAW